MKDWFLRVGDGENFWRSSKYDIWGIQTVTQTCGKFFLRTAEKGDRLWFVTSKSQGKIIAMTLFKECKSRVLIALDEKDEIKITKTNKELGWEKTSVEQNWNIEVHYENLIDLRKENFLSKIKSPSVIRTYNPEKCAVNLIEIYEKLKK